MQVPSREQNRPPLAILLLLDISVAPSFPLP